VYGKRRRAPRTKIKSPEIEAVETRLRQRLGTGVRITERRKKGSIKIEYYSHDDLNRILELLGLQ
jgi:ParB family chromosome partitioning protein